MSKRILESAIDLTGEIGPLIKSLTLGKFLKWIITFIVVAAVVLFIYDFFFSSKFHFDKLERKLEILESVSKLHPKDSAIAQESKRQALLVIENLEPPKLSMPEVKTGGQPFSVRKFLIKFLGAFLIPLLIILVNKGEEDFRNIVVGSVMVGLIFGIIGYASPTIYSLWVHFGLIQIVEIGFLVALLKVTD